MPIDITAGPDPIEGFDTFATRQFWENTHGGRLHKKVIFIDACRSGFHPGLSEALTGEDSIFLGWSEYVDATTSYTSAEALFRETAEDAFPVLRAFVRECDAGQCVDPPDPDEPSAELLAAWDRADLRTREAIGIPAAPTYGFCGVSSTLPVEQTCPSSGGGLALSVSFGMTIEGVRAEEMAFLQDPLEFAYYQLRLFADVDETESGFALPLTDLSTIALGNDVYIDAPPGAMLAMDNVCPHQVVEYNPWVLLPAFDETMPGNDTRDRMYSWDGPFTIEIDPVVLP